MAVLPSPPPVFAIAAACFLSTPGVIDIPLLLGVGYDFLASCVMAFAVAVPKSLAASGTIPATMNFGVGARCPVGVASTLPQSTLLRSGMLGRIAAPGRPRVGSKFGNILTVRKSCPRCIRAASAKLCCPTEGEITPNPCGLNELLNAVFCTTRV